MPPQDIDSFIQSLSDIYPCSSTHPTENPWSWLAAIAFSALNRPEQASKVFEYAVKQLSTHQDKLLLAKKFRDSIFKAGIIFGYPKTINALIQLNTVMPEDLKESSVLRYASMLLYPGRKKNIISHSDTNLSLSDLQRVGQSYFDSGYGTTSESVRGLIHNSYPDLGYLTIAIAYGFVYSFSDILNKYETSYTMIAALIPSDLPRQVGWHFHSAIRSGATIEQVQAVRQIVIKVSEFCGKQWESTIPIVDKPE